MNVKCVLFEVSIQFDKNILDEFLRNSLQSGLSFFILDNYAEKYLLLNR